VGVVQTPFELWRPDVGQVDAMSALSHVYCDRTRRGGLRGHPLSACRQTLAALAVSAVAGFAVFATAAGSLTQGALAAPPEVKSPPPGWIEIAFADVEAASSRSAVRPQQTRIGQEQTTPKQTTPRQDTRTQDPCADFVYYFLNTSCSIKHVGALRRDGPLHRAVAARTLPAPKQEASRNAERVSFAATTTTATD
jgi:hypothetical protein